MRVLDLGTMAYRDAWALQEQAHAEVLAGGEEQLLLVEHPPVITFGRRPGVDQNILANAETLSQRGVEVVPSDRGGDVTFHGPGQLVAYPIVRLLDHHLSVGGYVHRLEDAMIAALRDLGVPAQKDVCAVGVWVPVDAPVNSGPGCVIGQDALAKVCAIGVRIRRGVTLHGVALNVTNDLSYFDLIVPCGLKGRRVTSLQALLLGRAPTMAAVKQAVIGQLKAAFS